MSRQTDGPVENRNLHRNARRATGKRHDLVRPASEQFKLENWAEAAESLRHVVSLNPDYTAAYQMLGTVMANDHDLAGAKQAWRDGIEAAGRTGAWKAEQHMQALLADVAGE